MDFLSKVQYLAKSILEKYLPFAQDSFKNYLEDTKIRYYKSILRYQIRYHLVS